MTIHPDSRRARAQLELQWPAIGSVVDAWAPGRCTLVGEHVDYVGGLIACVAIDRGIGVALQPSRDAVWRVTTDLGDRVERSSESMQGDLADRVIAVALAMRQQGLTVEPCEVAIAASLPVSAGLSSSAALSVAVALALARNTGMQFSAAELVDIAYIAEHDVVGVPCGRLDQHAVVEGPAGGALILDCASDSISFAAWPWEDVLLAVCNTGTPHDVGGRAYAERVQDATTVLNQCEVDTCQELNLDRVLSLGGRLARRGRHLFSETRRTQQAVDALAAADPVALGDVMSASHASLAQDYEVSTPVLDAAVRAAQQVAGCHGARLVGAGFGGSLVALVNRDTAEDCRIAMTTAARVEYDRSWLIRPSAGAALLAPDVLLHSRS